MTITLHWWMIPIALVLAGVVGLARNENVIGACWLWLCCFCAVAFTVGHFV